MTSIRLVVSSKYNPEDVRRFQEMLGFSDDPYPDYELQIADDMKFISTIEEFKECLDEVMSFADRFEIIYLGKVGEEARLVKTAAGRNKRMSIVQPPFFAKRSVQRSKKVETSQAIVKYNPRQGSNFFLYGGLMFLIALGISCIYLSRRNRRQASVE